MSQLAINLDKKGMSYNAFSHSVFLFQTLKTTSVAKKLIKINKIDSKLVKFNESQNISCLVFLQPDVG
jgi:hypothetical protein